MSAITNFNIKELVNPILRPFRLKVSSRQQIIAKIVKIALPAFAMVNIGHMLVEGQKDPKYTYCSRLCDGFLHGFFLNTSVQEKCISACQGFEECNYDDRTPCEKLQMACGLPQFVFN